ncbi:MAG: DUF59 domain-containing protein [Phycisphaerales bacterium]|nr:MAG: DUF59 domain-containing protein [Phycisphaerales bacterium]
MSEANNQSLQEQVIDVLRTIYDPEVPVSIYELGLIYNVDISPKGVVHVSMTLTSPACPVAESLPPEVDSRLQMLDGVTDVVVEVVWDPPWSFEMMSDAARLELNL